MQPLISIITLTSHLSDSLCPIYYASNSTIFLFCRYLAKSLVHGGAENDFVSLERLALPKGVYGGSGYLFQSISDGRDLVRAVYLLKKQRPSLEYLWYAYLSRGSPDWYESMSRKHPPPFQIDIVQAGPRIGYRWSILDSMCEVNWLDPEPDSDSSDYEEYIAKLQEINNEVQLYRGFHQPPTEEEYQRLIEALPEESDIHYWTLEIVDEL